MPGDTAWLASPVAAKLSGNGLNRLRGNYRIFWTGNLGMSSLSRKWAISSTVAFALVFFASIFVLLAISPGRDGIKVERRDPLKSFLRRLDD